jgi:hypothetical protein
VHTDAAKAAAELDQDISAYILSEDGGSETVFTDLALRLFAYQYAHNPPYRAFCDQRGVTPSDVRRWQDIPAVSAASFADARLACFPPERTALRFVSSGTTRAGGRPSVHELETTRLYDLSLSRQFARWVLPDRDVMPMFCLAPPFEDAPHSSLSYMLSRLRQRYAAGGGFFVHGDCLDADALCRALAAVDEPALVFGTAFAFVHFIDFCRARGIRFDLPPGSRILETGGFKGRSRTVERDDLYADLSALFGVSAPLCLSEYGMCELGSQWYDASLRDTILGAPPRDGLKMGPHWARIAAVDPVSGADVPPGKPGLLQVVDLANRGSVAAVVTGDLVRLQDGGFVYLGRSPAAPPKGCSLTMETLRAAGG